MYIQTLNEIFKINNYIPSPTLLGNAFNKPKKFDFFKVNLYQGTPIMFVLLIEKF